MSGDVKVRLGPSDRENIYSKKENWGFHPQPPGKSGLGVSPKLPGGGGESVDSVPVDSRSLGGVAT